jgi:uncharacterized phiE125 gp8 family phage protein
MKRLIVTPAVLPPAALAELKDWLGITTAHDDAPLTALLRTALETCEDFTGRVPLECECEELLPARSHWQSLTARPIQTVTGVSAVPLVGPRVPLATDSYALEVDADGGACFRLRAAAPAERIAVRFVAGIVGNWESLPDSLRHGILRLAAHQHRQRESGAAEALPPAAVAALWRPWRRVRLA